MKFCLVNLKRWSSKIDFKDDFFLFMNNTIILQSIWYNSEKYLEKGIKWKKKLEVVATSMLLFVGCTEDKKEAKEQVAPKQEVTQKCWRKS